MSVTFLLIRQVNIVELATFKKRTVGKQNRLLIRNNVDSLNVQICQKNQSIGCVIPRCKLKCGITQPFFWLLWHICICKYIHGISRNHWITTQMTTDVLELLNTMTLVEYYSNGTGALTNNGMAVIGVMHTEKQAQGKERKPGDDWWHNKSNFRQGWTLGCKKS